MQFKKQHFYVFCTPKKWFTVVKRTLNSAKEQKTIMSASQYEDVDSLHASCNIIIVIIIIITKTMFMVSHRTAPGGRADLWTKPMGLSQRSTYYRQL